MPRCSIYHPKFLIAQALVTKIFELIQKPLDDSLYTDDNVVALNDELKRCSKARSPRGTRIALVGDMGTGKSSMLNSLLSVGVLARKVSTALAIYCGRTDKLKRTLGRYGR